MDICIAFNNSIFKSQNIEFSQYKQAVFLNHGRDEQPTCNHDNHSVVMLFDDN